jgi:hypothetical protein
LLRQHRKFEERKRLQTVQKRLPNNRQIVLRPFFDFCPYSADPPYIFYLNCKVIFFN